LRDRSGIDVQLDLPASMNRLTRDEELTLFRVAQEALTNIHRHSDSPWAWLRLTTGADGVVLEIEDGGVGIRSGDSSQPEDGWFALGVGLAGMRERIRQVGGTFTVLAGRTGTVVRASLPIVDHGLNERLSA
jgi:two-component system, NarL family, sensor kinase